MLNLFNTGAHLSGARDMLLVLMKRCADIDFVGKSTKQKEVYNKAITDWLLSDKFLIQRFMYEEPMRFYDHKTDNKGKLTSVKVCFESDYKKIKKETEV